jgi:hypothetical protein
MKTQFNEHPYPLKKWIRSLAIMLFFTGALAQTNTGFDGIANPVASDWISA